MYRDSQNYPKMSMTLAIVGIFISVLIGGLITLFPSFFVIGLIGGLSIVAISVFYPMVGLFALLLLTFGLIPFLPLDYRVMSELCLYALLVSMAFSLIFSAKWKNIYQYISPWKLPLLVLGLVWVIAFFKGIIIAHNHFGVADARRYLGLLAIFIVAAAEAKKPGMANKLAIFFGFLGAFELTIQMITGVEIIAGFRGHEELTKEFEDITRGNVNGGIYLIVYSLFYFVLTTVTGNQSAKKINYLLLIILMVAGLVATFSRGLWFGVFLAAILIIFFSNKIRFRLFGWATAIIMILLILASVAYSIKPRLIDATIARVLSVQVEGKKGTSLGARFDENKQAIDAAKKNLLFGMGHGAEYKKYLTQTGRNFDNEVTFIHNGYLWILVKMGILGLSGILLLSYRMLRLSTETKKPAEKLGIAFVQQRSVFATFIVFLFNGITSPVWAQFPDLVALSMLLVILVSSKLQEIKK